MRRSRRSAVDLIVEHYLCQEVDRYAPPSRREDWRSEAELSERSIFCTIRDYLTMACAGEARHAWDYCKTAHLVGGPFGKRCPVREYVYEGVTRYNPISLLRVTRNLFSEEWENGYGGHAWYEIAALALEMWSVDPWGSSLRTVSLYVERAINMAHNLGPVFNKPVLIMENSCEFLRSVLDAFANADCTADALRRAEVCYVRLPSWAGALLRRQLQDMDYSVQILTDDDCPCVEWGNEPLDVELVPKYEEEEEEEDVVEEEADANAKLVSAEREQEAVRA
jgi:hypothetical protein